MRCVCSLSVVMPCLVCILDPEVGLLLHSVLQFLWRLISLMSVLFSFIKKHPQREDYWGHVNPIGPRACYDEGKRVAETMCYAYAKQVP